MICDIAAYIIKLFQISEDTNNPVYKLMTDNLQLVTINVPIRSIFEHQGFTRWCSDARGVVGLGMVWYSRV